jgi:hypothetical protein
MRDARHVHAHMFRCINAKPEFVCHKDIPILDLFSRTTALWNRYISNTAIHAHNWLHEQRLLVSRGQSVHDATQMRQGCKND